jgi:ADP-heptose:LPS heptosyltransferase
MVPKTLAQAIKRWPTADLAELLLLVKVQLDKRAAHHAKGGGIEAEVAKRARKKLPRDAKQNA